MPYIIRRRNLGKTSVREIVRHSTQGIRAFRNDQWPAGRFLDPGLVFRWGCTSDLPHPTTGVTVVNQAEAIHRVSNKRTFREILDANDLCPPTWQAGNQADITYPCIVRPETHHQGRNFHVCRNAQEVGNAIVRCGQGWYASPLINKVAEYRVFVVQGRCVCVARKYPGNPTDVAWNVARGGRFVNVRWNEWPLKAVKTSIRAFLLSGLDFGGVDVIVDPEGSCFVLEINAAPSLTSPYRQTCFAKAFDYIVEYGKEVIPLPAGRGGYTKFIHPAITENVTNAR